MRHPKHPNALVDLFLTLAALLATALPSDAYDLNEDGKVNHSDYRLLAAAVVSGTYNAAYDLNGDGTLDAVDANLLLDQIPVADQVYIVNGVSFTMVAVKGGTFTMGTNSAFSTFDDEMPAHQVTLTDYWIGETEVTEALWTAIMGSNPSKNKKGGNYPVEYVSWNDCWTFITKLNALTGATFRLPTEAEWEFAARGGNASKGFMYAGGGLDDVTWYDGNSSSAKHPVATKTPNELGLYDMSGNVCEWCQDRYSSSYYSSSPTTNPMGPATGNFRVNRGGSWNSYGILCCVTRRNFSSPTSTISTLGLRLAQ